MALRSIREFIGLEASAGIILFATAVLALFVDNSALASYYENFFNLKFSISLGGYAVEISLLS